jgi:hypothetical protein
MRHEVEMIKKVEVIKILKTLLARYDTADDYNRPTVGWTLKRFYEAVVRHQG